MRNLKKWLIASLGVVSLALIASPFVSVVAENNQKPQWSQCTISQEYLLDDVISIPERTLSVAGEEYDAEIKLRYPDNSVYFANSGNVTLSKAGQYTLIYEAYDEASQYYKDEIDFFVADKLWRVSSAKSSVSYGTVGETSGLMVRLAKNDTLTFNKIIDVSDLSLADVLIKGFVNPDTVGAYDFDKLIFTLTDVYNPMCSLTIQGHRSTDTSNQKLYSYWTAAGTGQTLAGLYYKGDGSTVFYSGGPYGYRGYGAICSWYSQGGKHTSSGFVTWDVPADECTFTLNFDAQSNSVGFKGITIADLDNNAYYSKEPLWTGFPSGQVKLSITAADYAGEAANFCISQLAGYDLGMENKFIEEDAPEITVNVEEKFVANSDGRYSFTPLAVVGGNYPVPQGSAVDAYSGEVQVQTKVYYNYTSANKEECPIKNGCFAVESIGNYAVVYSATDWMGNTAERVYWIRSVVGLADPLMLTVTTDGAATNAVCGESVKVATYSTSGGSGDVVVTVTASCGDVCLTVQNGEFIPEKAGVWTVNYVAKDYAGILKRFTYEIVVENGSKPIYVDEVVLPRYLLSGLTYDVPLVYANDYSSGSLEKCVSDMILVDANGKHTYKYGECFTPVATEDNPFVKLIFNTNGVEIEKDVAVVFPIENKNIYLEKMFIGNNFTYEKSDDGLKFLANETGDFDWMFANAVAAENASVSLKGIKGNSLFDAMRVTFIDSLDESIAVTLNAEVLKNGCVLACFGDLEREMVKGFNLGVDANGFSLNDFEFSYKYGKFYIDSLSATVEKDDSGNLFKGFPSGRVYISIKVENATAGSGYIVKQFDNNVISSSNRDRTKPRISFSGTYGGMYALNELYILDEAIVSDTIDANVKGYVTVYDPDNNIVKDVDGVALEGVLSNRKYVIKLTTYGQYTVIYRAEDCNGRNEEFNYTINLFDQTNPVAELESEYKITATIGEQIVLPKVYVSDDYSELKDMTVYRAVRNPNGTLTTLGYDYTVNESTGELSYINYKFTFRYAGEYDFIILVADAAGNQAVVQYTVVVK